MPGRYRRWRVPLLAILLGGFAGGCATARPVPAATQAGATQIPEAPAPVPGPQRPQRSPLPGELWDPPDIDAEVQVPNSGAACSLPDVLAQAGKRVQELVGNLDRFTATEFVEHQSVNMTGRFGQVQTRRFDYAVSIRPGTGGYLSVQEYRSHVANPEQFPDGVSTEGTPSLILVFHPLYASDFNIECEGLGTWQGQPAWEVRFEQRRDRANRLNNVVVGDKMYSLRLRGRAWILADSYQVTRLETDLADAMSAIGLLREHMSVEYRPVAFRGRQTELWLPASVEMYVDFSRRQFYRKHRFTSFTLFSVDVNQQISGPPADPTNPQ